MPIWRLPALAFVLVLSLETAAAGGFPLAGASQATQPPAPSQMEIDRVDALQLYRKAMGIDAPTEEKVKLLREAAQLDPTYLPALADAEQKLSESKKKQQEEQAKTLETQRLRSQRSTALAEASALHDQALALAANGDKRGALKVVDEAIAKAKQAGADQNVLEPMERLKASLEADLAWRRKVLYAGLGLAVIGLVALVLFLKKRVPRLEMVEGPERGRVFKLEKDVTTIGAVENESDVVVPDPYRKISRRHCQIARSGRHFFLVDCSRNGTFLNGRAVPKNEPVLLRTNDEITLSDDVILIFR
jgi:hypothetical protein